MNASPDPADAAPLAPEDLYFNRELSWLSFNERVLAEANRTSYPLLERLKFLSISGSNLDEFMMIRVAGIAGQMRSGVAEMSVDGRTPGQQMAAIAAKYRELVDLQQETLARLRPQLAAQGIHIRGRTSIDELPEQVLRQHFLDHVMPVLTPQAIDPA
ncbi:MAG: RNA degradosome polyphosphate kinase, partial [Erythrobacter sp.]|nr:RNA degradosome polyphosphate kinase [Erythrobacter sp.]